jgi:hypothetical protein
MKHRKLLILLLVLFCVNAAYAQLFKTIDAGKLQCFVYDHGCMSEQVKMCGNVYYYRGSYVTWDQILYETDNFEWPGGLLKDAGLFFGARNWTDTAGYTWDACITGSAGRKRESPDYQFPVPDEGGLSIRRYFKYKPPVIIKDGVELQAPFPMSGDEVAPGKVWGTADVMVESNFRLSMGVDVMQRVLAWSQPDHDDYIIWDWTFINTGNTDRDEDIELPGQTLEDVYITRITEAMINGSEDNKVMPTWAGTTEDHDTRLSYPQNDDSLRIDYVTPLRCKGVGYDSYGKFPSTVRTLLDGARFAGSAVLFAPKACGVPQNHPIPDIAASNDPAQPSMHTSLLAEPSWIVWDFPGMEEEDYVESYGYMVKGVFGIDSTMANFQDAYYMDSVYNVYDTTASGAKTHYEQPLDRWGELDPSRGWPYMLDIPLSPDYRRFDQQCHFSIGPYQMEFGDTIRFVFAYVGGAISRKTSYLLGEAWNNGEATSYDWLAGLDSAQMVDELSKRDPIFNIYRDTLSPALSLNDIAKDLMVATGKDSLFENGMNAQRSFNMNYNIPASPAPPSLFEVTSKTNMIELSWNYDETPLPLNLAGFKIYRASGDYTFEKEGTIIRGDWRCIDSVGPDVTTYDDTAGIAPGSDYFYALTAVNDAGVESGMYLTMTIQAARLTSEPDTTINNVRVVPNPLNINSTVGGSHPDDENKIMFVRLPGPCTIRILTESGKLVKVIEHKEESGIAQWIIGDRYMVTDADQRPVSGLYIAHITDTETGESISRKFVIVR